MQIRQPITIEISIKPNKQPNSLNSGGQFQMGMLHFPCFQLNLKDLQQIKARNQNRHYKNGRFKEQRKSKKKLHLRS